MPSYPIRPTFPVDVRSLSGGVKVGRVGTAVTIDLESSKVLAALPVTSGQLFSALEATYPGDTARVYAAVPSDPSNAINNAFRSTVFVTPDCVLLAFVKATLALTDVQVSSLLAAAALQPK